MHLDSPTSEAASRAAPRSFLRSGVWIYWTETVRLTYGSENVVEAYYNLAAWKEVHVTPDYEFVVNPASNRDRGPVSVLGIRLHWKF